MAPPRKRRATGTRSTPSPSVSNDNTSHFETRIPTETKNFNWEIKDFKTLSKVKGALEKTKLQFEAGHNIGLPTKWEFYFDREGEEDDDDIGFFLALAENKIEPGRGSFCEVFANFRIAIKRTNGTRFIKFSNRIRAYESDKVENAWGCAAVTTVSKITSPTEGALVNGTLTLQLTFYLYSNPKMISVGPKRKEFISTLSQDLGQLLDTGSESDVTFVTMDGQKVKAHRAILSARSQVFATMLGTQMRESVSGEIKLNDIGSDAWKIVLKYIYSGAVDEAWKEVDDYMQVVNAADKYGLAELKEYCDQTLGKKCNAENAMDLLKLASLHKLPTAAQYISDFIGGNLKVVLEHAVE